MADYNQNRDALDIQKFQESGYQAMAFPPVRGKMDAADSFELMERPGGPGNSKMFQSNQNFFAGGIPLRQLFPNAPSDVPFVPGMPGIVRPNSKQKLKDIFPSFPGGYGGEDGGPRYGTTPGGIVSNPFGSSNQEIAMAFPPVRGKMDAAESLKLMERPGGGTYYVGPGGKELTPEQVNRIMGASVRGA